MVGVILDLLNQECLPDRFHEVQVGSPPLLETKITHGLAPNQILQRLLQQRKRWFEVDTIGCEDDVRVVRDSVRTCFSPVVDVSGYFTLEVIQGDVLPHEFLHLCHVRHVDVLV